MMRMIGTRIKRENKEGPMCRISIHEVSSALEKLVVEFIKRRIGVIWAI